MNNSRIKILLQYLKDEPNDPFNIYALAMEYIQVNPSKSKVYFEELLDQHPDYLATYHHAAALFAEEGDKKKAENIYLKGIALAENQKNSHALRELKNAYNEFLFDE